MNPHNGETSTVGLAGFLAWQYHLRKSFFVVTFITILAATYFAFFVAKKYYNSSITFLPPAGAESSLAFLKGVEGLTLSSGQEVSADQVKIIFDATSFRRKLIDQFDLIRRYELEGEINPYQRAAKILDKHLSIQSDEVSGVGYSTIIGFTISAEDRSADTALAIVNASFSLLDSAVQEISVDRAHQRRLFLEKQIQLYKRQFDSLQEIFISFQKKNRLYNAPQQVNTTIDVVSQALIQKMQLELALELEVRKGGASSSIAKQIQAQIDLLKSRTDNLEKKQSPSLIPGITSSTSLVPQYLLLQKEYEARGKVIEYLSQQYESERISEAKLVSRLKVVDHAWKAEYKSRPKRISLILGIVLVELILFASISTCWFYVSRRMLTHPSWREFISLIRK